MEQVDEDESSTNPASNDIENVEGVSKESVESNKGFIKSNSQVQPLLASEEPQTILRRLEGYLSNPRLRFIPLLVYPYFGPFITSLSLTTVRMLTGFLAAEPEPGHTSNFDAIDVWILLFSIPLMGFSAYVVMNKALKHYDTIYIIPLFKVGTQIQSFLSGMIFLNELIDYNTEDLIFFVLGIMVCMSGVFVLILGNDKKEQEKIHIEQKAKQMKVCYTSGGKLFQKGGKGVY